MRVQVLEVLQQSEGLVTTLETSRCVIRAQWRGEPPAVGGRYDVEVNVEGVLTWGQNILEVGPLETRTGGLDTLDGTLEQVDEDGMAVVRISVDGLMMVEATGTAPDAGTEVRLTACRFTAFPFGR